MYHNTSSSYMNMLNGHTLPSPEYTGDSDNDSEISKELAQKHREFDEDIARFRAQKDREFKDFEADLKVARQQTRRNPQVYRNKSNGLHESIKDSPLSTSPARSTLTGCEKRTQERQKNAAFKQTEPIRLMKPGYGSKVTPPTIYLDNTNIRGQHMLQSRANPLQTPPSPTVVALKTSISQGHVSPTSTSSIAWGSEQPEGTSRSTPETKTINEARVPSRSFVSSFPPLLDAKIDRAIEGTQTEPASPTGPCMVEAVTSHATSLPTESSLSEIFQIPQTKRAYTSPTTEDRARLAPIIRNVNGRKRANSKRKHVTFQLADRAIVEPSSSYEEGRSPNLADDSSNQGGSTESLASVSSDHKDGQEVRPKLERKNTPRTPFGRRQRKSTPLKTPEEEIGMSMGDLMLKGEISASDEDYFSPRRGSQSSESSSPEKSTSFEIVNDGDYTSKRKNITSARRIQRTNSGSPSSSPGVSRQPSADHSPSSSKKPTQPYELPLSIPQPFVAESIHHRHTGIIESDLLASNSNVGFFELDEELSSPTADLPQPDWPDDKDEASETMESRRHDGRSASTGAQMGTSVPIDIVRPGSYGVSNSWIGTFGH